MKYGGQIVAFLVCIIAVLSYMVAFPSHLNFQEYTQPERAQSEHALAEYTLPLLPFAYDALEPHVSKQIMEIHHSKHHQAYVTNLNKALASMQTAISRNDVPTQIQLQAALRFNGGGHINHSLFWKNLTPANSTEARSKSAPNLMEAIKATWGSETKFKEKFAEALLGIQGSGWGWLVKIKHPHRDQLAIVTTKDQDPISGSVETPILGVDMWEHAYYLQYLNSKPSYINNIWKVINWKVAEERFLGNRQDVFAALKETVNSGTKSV